MGAKSSRPVVRDEEVQKASMGGDLEENNSGRPIAGELSCPCNGEDSKEQKGTKTDEKKTKLRVLPQEYVDILLKYKCGLHEPKYYTDTSAEEEDKKQNGHYKALVAEIDAMGRRQDDMIKECQNRLRHEVETKGYFAYEVADDEGEDGTEVAMAHLSKLVKEQEEGSRS